MDDVTRELLSRVAALEAKLARAEGTPAIPSYPTLVDAGAFGRAGRIIYVVDEGRIYRDTGAAWKASHTS
jgi:hypothetical protein